MPKHYKQKPLQQLHHTRAAQVLNTRERVRERLRAEPEPFAAPSIALDLGTDDRTGFITIDSMAMALESHPPAEGADYAEIERRLLFGIGEASRDLSMVTEGRSVMESVNRIAQRFRDVFPSLTQGLENLRGLIDSAPAPRMDLSRPQRRFHSGGIINNYPIQAAAAAAALESAILRTPAFFVSVEDAEQFSLDNVRSVYGDIAQTRLKGQKPHPDTGKVLPPPPRRLARSSVGVMVEEVRNADGTVSRRPKAPPRE